MSMEACAKTEVASSSRRVPAKARTRDHFSAGDVVGLDRAADLHHKASEAGRTIRSRTSRKWGRRVGVRGRAWLGLPHGCGWRRRPHRWCCLFALRADARATFVTNTK